MNNCVRPYREHHILGVVGSLENIHSILNKLPEIVEIPHMLTRVACPENGKNLWAIEQEIHKLTAKIGDQFVLGALKKVHQDKGFVVQAVQRASLERQDPIENEGIRLVSVLLLGGSKVVLRTPYFQETHGTKPGPKKKRRGKNGRGFYPVLEALGIRDGVSPASRSEPALYTIQAASYEEA